MAASGKERNIGAFEEPDQCQAGDEPPDMGKPSYTATGLAEGGAAAQDL